MLTTAPVRSRLLVWVRDCATYRSKKVSEGPSFRHISGGKQSEDRQIVDNCADRAVYHPIITSDQPMAMRVLNPTRGPATQSVTLDFAAGHMIP